MNINEHNQQEKLQKNTLEISSKWKETIDVPADLSHALLSHTATLVKAGAGIRQLRYQCDWLHTNPSVFPTE